MLNLYSNLIRYNIGHDDKHQTLIRIIVLLDEEKKFKINNVI